MSSEKHSNNSEKKSFLTVVVTSICFGVGYYVYKKRRHIKPVFKTIKNPLVAIVGISTYDGDKKPYTDLPGIRNDMTKHVNLWNGFFNYNLNILTDKPINNIDLDTSTKYEPITVKTVTRFFNNIRCLLTSYNHDALICVLSGHGHNDSLITSDKQPYKISDIKDYFCGNAMPSFSNKPKIFIIDVCRTDDMNNISYDEQLTTWKNIGGDQNSHPDSNICIIYSNTKNYAVPENDDGSPMIKCLINVMKATDLNVNDLNSVSIMISDALARETSNILCVETVSTNKFLVYLKKCMDGAKKVIVNDMEYADIDTMKQFDMVKSYLWNTGYILLGLFSGYIVYVGILTKANQNRETQEKYRVSSFWEFITCQPLYRNL